MEAANVLRANTEALRAKQDLAVLESVLGIAQREDAVVREAADARRTGISTVLGFNGVLIGLSVFAVGDVASGEGVLVGSGLLIPFAILDGLAIVALALSALALLASLLMDAHVSLSDEALAQLETTTESIKSGTATAKPTEVIARSILLLVGDGKVLDRQRKSDRSQGKVARLGLYGTGLGFVLLAAAGLAVVAEVL